MRKLICVFAFGFALGLAACASQPTQSGNAGATAPTGATSAPMPAASCGGSGKG